MAEGQVIQQGVVSEELGLVWVQPAGLEEGLLTVLVS